MQQSTRLIGISCCLFLILTTRLTAEDKQVEKEFQSATDAKIKMKYLLALPEGYEKSEKALPLIMFLHGSGESGDDLAKVKRHGPPKLIAEGKSFPFIVISPQSPGRGWDLPTLNGLLDDVISKYRVDKNRIYLTGLSMGGYGTWRLAAAYPEKFAAIAPICGGGNVDDAAKLKPIPVWAFHGAKDTGVPLARSEEMVNRLKELGAQPKLTVYPDAGHDSWTVTYNNPELYQWFLSNQRNQK